MCNKRNFGVDFLRLVSMYMIVALHVLGVGGVINNTISGSVQYYILYSLQIALLCCVNCFGLISGYVMAKRKINIKSFLKLWLQVFTYSVIISIIIYLLPFSHISVFSIFKSFFPIISNNYWYFNAYLGLFLVIPWINIIISHLNKKQFEICLLIMLVFASLMPNLLRVDIFNVSSGYSSIWLIILFFFGAYIKLYKDDFNNKKIILIYFFGIVFVLLYKIAMSTLTLKVFGQSKFSDLFLAYNSPIELVMSIALFISFKNLKINGKLLEIVKKLSPCAFGVYLIHTHPIFFTRYFKNSFGWLLKSNIILTLVEYLIIVSFIFIACLAIEVIRDRCMNGICKSFKKSSFYNKLCDAYEQKCKKLKQ